MDGSLLAWYDEKRRRLPWREKTSPYRTWVSEIMLQQTQVATATPYFERFMERFPVVASLAAADEEDVLRHWAGLGYYSRARNLHRAAREIASERGGRLPRDMESLMALPGIGRYTAAAISSIAFGEPNAVVDGNVIRVLARYYALRGDPKASSLQSRIWKLAQSGLDRLRPGDWNQAMMELGARICLPEPEAPRCGECPLRVSCQARKRRLERFLPESAATKPAIPLSWTALWIRRRNKILIWKRGANERFLRGHWGLPEQRHLRAATAGRTLATVRHSITFHRITLRLKEAAYTDKIPGQARWVPRAGLEDHLVSSLWRKAVQKASPA